MFLGFEMKSAKDEIPFYKNPPPTNYNFQSL